MQAGLKEAQLNAREATQLQTEAAGKIKDLEKKIRSLDSDIAQTLEVRPATLSLDHMMLVVTDFHYHEFHCRMFRLPSVLVALSSPREMNSRTKSRQPLPERKLDD